VSDWKIGDKVCIKPSASWLYYFKKLADTQRVGEVENVFIPHGADSPTVRVRFDAKRKGFKAKIEFLGPNDLVSAP